MDTQRKADTRDPAIPPGSDELRQESIHFDVFKLVPDAVLLVDQRGSIVEANPQAISLFGYSRDELIGEPVEILIPERFTKNHVGLRNEYMTAPGLRPMGTLSTLQAKRKDGTELPVDIMISPAPAALGASALAIIRDKTERAQLIEQLTMHRDRLKDMVEKATVRLRENEARFRAMFDNSPDAYLIMEIHERGRISDCNKSAETMLRGTKDQILGMTPDQVSPERQPDGRLSSEAAAVKIQECIRLGRNDFEWVHRRLDGEEFWAHVTISVITIEGREVLLVAWRDISVRKRIERELQASEEQFRTAMQHSPIGMALVAPDGRWLDVNGALCGIVGYAREELLALDYRTITHSEDLDNDLPYLRQMLDRQIDTYQVERRYIHKDGHTIWTQLNVSLSWNERGKPQHYICQIQDISERKRSESEKRRLSERLQTILEHASDGVHILDTSGNVVECSLSFARLLGYTREEAKGLNVKDWDARIPQDDLVPTIQALLRAPTTFETLHKRKDGSTFPSEINAHGIELEGDAFLYASTRDITERKRAEMELRDYAERLEISNRDLDDFSYIVSHDLKEPLRGIHNYSSFLLEDYEDKLEEDGKYKLQTLMRLTKRMEDLLESLLFYSRIGRAEIAHQEVATGDLVHDVLQSLEHILAERHVQVEVARDMPLVTCDRVRAGHVFRNLIVNAVKYNDNESKEVVIGWNSTDGGAPRFFVRDNGIGIPDKHKEKVFHIFKRLHGRDAYGGGTGAGLTIVRKIVERHGGHIWVDSQPGVGSTFYFTLAPETVSQESNTQGR